MSELSNLNRSFHTVYCLLFPGQRLSYETFSNQYQFFQLSFKFPMAIVIARLFLWSHFTSLSFNSIICRRISGILIFTSFPKHFLPKHLLPLPVFPSRTNLKLHKISVTPSMVKRVITNLDSSKAFGPDCSPVLVLKNCEPELSQILAELFSISVRSCLVF